MITGRTISLTRQTLHNDKGLCVCVCVCVCVYTKYYDLSQHRYTKDLHDQDNHDGVITHLEPDILECEVKWALERKHHYEQS